MRRIYTRYGMCQQCARHAYQYIHLGVATRKHQYIIVHQIPHQYIYYQYHHQYTLGGWDTTCIYTSTYTHGILWDIHGYPIEQPMLYYACSSVTVLGLLGYTSNTYTRHQYGTIGIHQICTILEPVAHTEKHHHDVVCYPWRMVVYIQGAS